MEFQLTSTVDVQEWDALVAASPQGSIFSDSRYLAALARPYTCYLAQTPQGETLAGVVVMEDKGAMHSAPFQFTPYQGILFSESVARQPCHKRITSEFRITEFLIQSLIRHYGNFSMAFSPAFTDMRPFLWHNYHAPSPQPPAPSPQPPAPSHQPPAPSFNIRLRYTAILDVDGFDMERYLADIRSVRRQENKKSQAVVSDSTEVEEFLNIYIKTFQRQGITITEDSIRLVRQICMSAIENNFGRLSKAVLDGTTASMSLFVFDKRCAYYLFGANDPGSRNTGASSRLMINNISYFSNQGQKKIDFVGVNSPNRGDYKVSFGPDLAKYFEVELVDSK